MHDSNKCSADNSLECQECSLNCPHVLSDVYGREGRNEKFLPTTLNTVDC